MKTYIVHNKNVIIDGATVKHQVVGDIHFTAKEIQDLLKENPELLTPTPTHKRKYFVPKVGENYLYLDRWGTKLKTMNQDTAFDNHNFSIGNSFEPNTTDAQDELNRRQALVRIWNNYDDKYSWDIDWEDKFQEKHFIFYDSLGKRLSTDYSMFGIYNTELPYFKSAEDRNQFVESNMEDLLVVFNIKK